MQNEMNQMKTTGKYQLRYAAGIYWLLDTEQSGRTYRDPIPMNELGADIWRSFVGGMNTEQIIQHICEEYETDKDVVREDVNHFFDQLKAQKIFVGKE